MQTRNLIICHVLTGIALASLMTSCSPVLYTTVGQNVPLFHKKGEVALSGSHSATSHASGFSGNLAMAVSDHTAIISSVHSLTSNKGSGNGAYFEFGGGRFWHDPKTRVTEELFGGVGFGSISNSRGGGVVTLSYVKPFIQPSTGISGKVCEFAFTPRIAVVSYTSKSGYIPDEQSTVDDFYAAKKNTLVFEPGFTFRIGYKNVKIQMQYNYSSFTYKNSTATIDEEFVSIGLHFNITDWWDKK